MELDGRINSMVNDLAERGIQPGSMREYSQTRGMYQSRVPNMLEAKRISDAEMMAQNQALAEGKILN